MQKNLSQRRVFSLENFLMHHLMGLDEERVEESVEERIEDNQKAPAKEKEPMKMFGLPDIEVLY